MKPRSLHLRLAGTLLVLLAIAGAFLVHSTLVTTELYFQEVSQRMNLDLAANIARMKHDQLVDARGEIRGDGMEELLHWMMVVNPGPHFYLLDLDGKVVAYDPSAGDVLDDRVDLAPVRELIDLLGRGAQPDHTVLGDDPREPGRRKVFSAAPLPPRGGARGYLYIVLADHRVESVAEQLRGSYILRLGARNVAAYLAVVLLTAFLVFGLLTRPLRRLTARMQEFRRQEPPPAEAAALADGDEVRLLDQSFAEMSRRIEQQLAEIERISQTRRELIANVSHDLRTPIASLRGYLDTLALKDESLTRQERDEYVRIALRQSERLGKLVRELFELTKLDAREVEPQIERFKIAELVQDNVQRFQLEAERRGVALMADFDPDLPPVFADIGLMERVLENLIENALRFTPAGGSVSVALREDPNSLVVEVSDTGCGIAEEDLPHIFDRYYRSRATAASSEGAGLGLAITRRILELHDSELEIRSRRGEGTTVSFALAVAPRSHQLSRADLASFAT